MPYEHLLDILKSYAKLHWSLGGKVAAHWIVEMHGEKFVVLPFTFDRYSQQSMELMLLVGAWAQVNNAKYYLFAAEGKLPTGVSFNGEENNSHAMMENLIAYIADSEGNKYSMHSPIVRNEEGRVENAVEFQMNDFTNTDMLQLLDKESPFMRQLEGIIPHEEIRCNTDKLELLIEKYAYINKLETPTIQ